MKQEILADSENVKVVRDIYEFEFDFRQMPNGYVSELISNDEIEQWNRQETIENIYWQPNLPVFISAQTGSGKNYFITHNLRLYAKEQGYNILYISNRVALDFQQKQELAKLTHVKLYKNEESWENTETFDNVTVTTYQKLYKYFSTKEKNWFKNFNMLCLTNVISFIATHYLILIQSIYWKKLRIFCR